MKLKPLAAFNSKFFKPCTKFFLKLKKTFLIRRRRTFRLHYLTKKRGQAPSNRSTPSSSHSKDMDRVGELKGEPASHVDVLLHSPAYRQFQNNNNNNSSSREFTGNEEVEDACRSFENYLVQMIVEEGKTKDLMDVEELLYCWKSLKSPVFIDLVSTFYGDLCKDLFSTQ